jgi:hypothetical protein
MRLVTPKAFAKDLWWFTTFVQEVMLWWWKYLSCGEKRALGGEVAWICCWRCCSWSGEIEGLAGESLWLLTLEEVAAPDQDLYWSACETINPWPWFTVCWLTRKSISDLQLAAGAEVVLPIGIINDVDAPVSNVKERLSFSLLIMWELGCISDSCMTMSELRLKLGLFPDLKVRPLQSSQLITLQCTWPKLGETKSETNQLDITTGFLLPTFVSLQFTTKLWSDRINCPL